MKNLPYTIRLIAILTAGLALVKLTYQSIYSTFLFDSFLLGAITTIGLLFLAWSTSVDLKQYKIQKNRIYLIPITLGTVFILIISIMNWRIAANFNKPTLLRIHYSGDFNGTGFDFKTDGTYIFDNSSMGCSDYQYGTYQIAENRITLDKGNLDNVITTNLLKIESRGVRYSSVVRKEKYVYQVDKIDKTGPSSNTEFIVVVDNRVQ